MGAEAIGDLLMDIDLDGLSAMNYATVQTMTAASSARPALKRLQARGFRASKVSMSERDDHEDCSCYSNRVSSARSVGWWPFCNL